jgi:5-methylcytosine-specific restriction endonuclease McrA
MVEVVCRYCQAVRLVPSYYAGRYSTCGSDECKAKRIADRTAVVKAANTGRVHTPEVNQAKGRPGRQQSAEHVAKRVASRQAKGWFQDPEIGAKISAATAGKPRPERAGSNNPQWKGGVAKLNQHGRGTKEYQDWRHAVLERAGGQCERCGSTSFVVAHHRFSWVNHPELRAEPDNGEALCRACHAREHDFARHLSS